MKFTDRSAMLDMIMAAAQAAGMPWDTEALLVTEEFVRDRLKAKKKPYLSVRADALGLARRIGGDAAANAKKAGAKVISGNHVKAALPKLMSDCPFGR